MRLDIFVFLGPLFATISVSHTVKLMWIQSTLFCNIYIWFRTEAITFLKFNISPIAVQGSLILQPALRKTV
jgi:hypothetical protein